MEGFCANCQGSEECIAFAEMDADAPPQFLRLLTAQLADAASEVGNCVSRCGELCITGARHQEMLDRAHCCARELASLFMQSPCDDEAAFFSLGLESLISGGGNLLKSLFALHRISPHEPMEPQHAASWLACKAVFGGSPAAAASIARSAVLRAKAATTTCPSSTPAPTPLQWPTCCCARWTPSGRHGGGGPTLSRRTSDSAWPWRGRGGLGRA